VSTTTRKLWAFRVGIGADGTANVDWSRSFDATGEDLGYSVGQLADGTLLVGGTSQSLGDDPVANLWFMRTQQNGAITFPSSSGVTEQSLTGQIYQTDTTDPSDGGVSPSPVVTSSTGFVSKNVAVTVVDDPLTLLDTSLTVRALAP
jgi:hypothetical protein